MTPSKRAGASVAFASFALIGEALAQAECDPEKILRDNIKNVTLDRETALAISTSRDSESSRDVQDKFAGTYEQYKLDYDSQRSMSRKMSEQSSTNYTEEQRETLYEAVLSEASVDAYMACLNQRPLRVQLSGKPAESKNVPVKITWDYAGVGPSEAQLRIRTRNGRVESADGATSTATESDAHVIQVPITRGSTLQFEIIDRDVWAETVITAAIVTSEGERDAAPLNIPPKAPKFAFSRSLMREAVNLRSSNPVRSQSYCIRPTANDSILLAKTATWEGALYPSNSYRATFAISRSSDLEVCGRAFADGSKRKKITAFVEGSLAVEQMTIRVLPRE